MKRQINDLLGSRLIEEKSYAGAALIKSIDSQTRAPTISVILPVHNGGRFLNRSIGSVLAQEFSDWELVVVDDGSTDDTFQRLQEYAERDARIRPVRANQNRGPTAARNAGLKASRGAIIAYLDCDDAFAPWHLGNVARCGGSGDVVLFTYEVWSELADGRPPVFSHVWDPIRNRDRLWEQNISTPLGVTHSRRLLDRSGHFSETLFYEEDWDLWKRFAGTGAGFVFVPQIAGRYFVRDGRKMGFIRETGDNQALSLAYGGSPSDSKCRSAAEPKSFPVLRVAVSGARPTSPYLSNFGVYRENCASRQIM